MAEQGTDMTKRDSDFLATMTDEQRQQWIKDIVHRMMQAWDVPSKIALAAKLGLNPKAPSNWIQKPHDALQCDISLSL